MIVKTPTSFLRLREVYSLTIVQRTQKVVVEPWDWTTFWKPAVIEEISKWHLDMIYLSEDGLKSEVGWNCQAKEPIEQLMDSIVKQIKEQDHEIMDRAFEEAVANLERNK